VADSSPAIDAELYGRLLAVVQPGLIETPEEHERLIAVAERLIEKGAELPAEEEKLLALLTLLIEAYEAGFYEEDEDDEEAGETVTPAQPHETLRRLLEARSLELSDVADIFGNPRAAHEALDGRRPISRGQARQLAQLFQVPAKLFST
jgi:antitoxin component HigA of HigAB toxin-antitoxin module